MVKASRVSIFSFLFKTFVHANDRSQLVLSLSFFLFFVKKGFLLIGKGDDVRVLWQRSTCNTICPSKTSLLTSQNTAGAGQRLSGAQAGQFSRNCAQQSSGEQAGSITGRQGAVVQNRNKQVNIASKCQANGQVRNRRGRSQAGRKEINPGTSHRAQSGTEQVKVRTQQKKTKKTRT